MHARHFTEIIQFSLKSCLANAYAKNVTQDQDKTNYTATI